MPWSFVSPAPQLWRRLVRAAAHGCLVAGVIIGLAFAVRLRVPALIALDDAVTERAVALTRAHDGMRAFWLRWAWWSLPGHGYLVAAIVCLWAGLRRGLRTRATWAFITMMLVWGIGSLLKRIVQRPRPEIIDPITTSPGFSFPSGHASNAAAVSVALVILLWPLLRRGWPRTLALTLATAYTAVTAADRVLLGVHYIVDITAGVILGAGIVLASYAGYAGWSPRD